MPLRIIEDTSKRLGIPPRKVFELCYEHLGITRPQDEARNDWVKYQSTAHEHIEPEVVDFCLDVFSGKIKVLHGELV